MQEVTESKLKVLKQTFYVKNRIHHLNLSLN